MQFARELAAPATTVDAVSALLAACDQPFERSQLYSTVTESKFVDESLRRSEFRAIRQAALFDACETLLAQVTSGDPLNDFYLLRSDVTHIVYKVRAGSCEGGGGARGLPPAGLSTQLQNPRYPSCWCASKRISLLRLSDRWVQAAGALV